MKFHPLLFCSQLLLTTLPNSISHGEERKFVLQQKQVTESSGVAVSMRNGNVFWTHNDSGDSPRVFAFDDKGNHLAEIEVQNAKAVDWEDLECFWWKDQSWLLVADTGDNNKKRESVILYAFPEPEPVSGAVKVERSWQTRIPTGSADCEAVAVDSHSGDILLIEKTPFPAARVWRVPLTSEREVVAEVVGKIPVPFVTAATFNATKRCLLIGTYADAFAYQRQDDEKIGRSESWTQVFSRFPQQVRLPKRSQGEAIALFSNGESMIVTSEGRPATVWIAPFTLTSP